MSYQQMKTILSQFRWEGDPIRCERYGNGHINETYIVETDVHHCYILQKINKHVFHDIEGLMHNIIAVTDYLHRNNPDPRHVLTLIPTQDSKKFYLAIDGECWRAYEFITDSICLDHPENENDLRQSGIAFGQFQNQLADFPAHTLIQIIPGFHDTPVRFQHLSEAIKADRVGRLSGCAKEIDWYLKQESKAGSLIDLLDHEQLPLRVTHNDTKLNNVMLDRKNRTPLCVIDLDTIMPGLAAYDFGDSIRFGASTASEDEKDLSKVTLSLSLYKAYTEGFLSACGKRLTLLEKETLPLGARIMTLECGVRFLTDWLNGDQYFHISYPEQNLDRARTQMKLVQDMDQKWNQLYNILRKTQSYALH